MTVTDQKVDLIPDDYAIAGVYPNPFNSMTTIRCELPERSEVRLSAYDVKGRLVDDLFAGTLDAGRHSINWSPASLSSGLYLIRMEAGGNVRMARGVMVR